MRMSMFYFPMMASDAIKAKHPYSHNLLNILSDEFDIVNYGCDKRAGAADAWAFFEKAHFFYFNWVENMRHRNVPAFLWLLIRLRLAGKKIIWTHHNTHPHRTSGLTSKALIYILSRISDHVVIHTRESFRLLGLSRDCKRVLHFFHPFFTREISNSTTSADKEYDLLLWGTVRGSKGIADFMHYVRNSKRARRFKILVVGQFESEHECDELRRDMQQTGVRIENRFVEDDELSRLHASSKYVFSPYTGSSNLNSGSLINSIPRGALIIGPRRGAFKEAGERGLIQLYDSFEDVFDHVEAWPARMYPAQRVADFMQRYTWSAFGERLVEKLEGRPDAGRMCI